MATILLSAAGAALGGSIGGTALGLSSAVIGRAVGATLGKVIDQRVLGAGAAAVEHGKVDRFRLTEASEGAPVRQVFGRMRIGGQVIWASDFIESSTTSGGGGKGAPSTPRSTQFSYSVSLAVALCGGVISGVGRVWADGEEVALRDLNMRVYHGTDTQLPDSVMEAIEGAGQVPAYRGTAYVVFDSLPLAQFGNRVPQFSFEVSRPEQPGGDQGLDLTRAISAVAMMPGTGEYALATTPVNYTEGPGARWSANVNTPAGITDFALSLESLSQDLPGTEAAALIVSWFGNDLRCRHCRIRPKIEKRAQEGENMPWRVAGLDRAGAQEVPRLGGDPVYGGTPTDASVLEAIRALQDAGKAVMFYPFILMDQMDGNTLPDPYGAAAQAALPWRGRITLDAAPGQPGSSDGTPAAQTEVEAFFGTVRAGDFTVTPQGISYSGPAQDWGFARFILHYAALCAQAGGVEAFCIGSEMRGVAQIRGPGNSFPFVQKLIQLAADVRALLGPSVKISYAADWSEYFGYIPADGSGDRFFHLDPLWADANIDFIGIDNYMPLADWRDGTDHADAGAGSIHDLDYLRGNIAGGEGYDWFYATPEQRAAQVRKPITDGAYGEPWVYRYKDLRGWWENPHHERLGGIRQPAPTPWVPASKPIWFTEYGCAAIDKGANQPNAFLDAKSSESAVPHFSNGARDDLMQMQYLRAMSAHYADPGQNPVSPVYGGPMVEMSRAFVWAWDARPYPFFPNNLGQWSDGANYPRGHWISGRIAARTLASVVTEICARAGVTAIDTSGLHGHVRGYEIDVVGDARAALQPLMLRHGFDVAERGGVLRFTTRGAQAPQALDLDWLARAPDMGSLTERDREAELELSGRMRLQFVEADGDYAVLAEEAVLPDAATHGVATSSLPMVLTRGEGRQVVERWLAEARVARDRVRFALPPSNLSVGAGDTLRIPGSGGAGSAVYRVDRIEHGALLIVEAVRIEPSLYLPAALAEERPALKPFAAPVPVTALLLDLPLLTGDEVPHAPHIAASAAPWPGRVAVYSAATDANYALNTALDRRAVTGITQAPLARAPHGLWDHGGVLEVRLHAGFVEAAPPEAVLAGANAAAIGDGSPDNWEVLQFAQATLTPQGTYRLSGLLRGQQGTDALMPEAWPAGSWFVLLDGAPQQMDLKAGQRQVTRHLRIGPARASAEDASYRHLAHAFAGNGLRPYAPAHLAARRGAGGDLLLSWVRRSRIDGDVWTGEVPLGEDAERYRVEVIADGAVLRTEEVTAPDWRYDSAVQAADGASGVIEITVAQVSARFGPGLAARLQVSL